MADPIKKPEENMNAAGNSPKPATGTNPAPVKQPKPVASAPMNPPTPPTGNNNNPPQSPKGPKNPKDPVREKILKQGFAPKNWDGESNLEDYERDKKIDTGHETDKTKKFWDRYNGLTDDQKKDFALNVYKYGTNSFDNPLGKFRDPYTGEIMYADAEDGYSERDDYLLGKDEDSRNQLRQAVDDLDINNMDDNEIEKLFSEYPTQDLEPWDEDDSSQRERASKLFGTDLTNK